MVVEGKTVWWLRLSLLPFSGFSSEMSQYWGTLKLLKLQHYWWSSNVRGAFLLYLEESVTTIHPPLAAMPSDLTFCSFSSQEVQDYFELVSIVILYMHLHVLTPAVLCRDLWHTLLWEPPTWTPLLFSLVSNPFHTVLPEKSYIFLPAQVSSMILSV